MSSVAIVGMACRYPDARTPAELWENALAQRRAFRRMPAERLRLEDYFSSDRAAPDRTYSRMAAVIEGYEFDRVRFRVSGATFRSVDMTHWLALDVASQALADAGFAEGVGLPRESTGVFVGNTLAGEFARANVMRLRWPYVRRVVEAALAARDWPAGERRSFLDVLEERYKSPFPPVGEETLAGGMSNTIAGRICNHFDLQGGGYALDGACASSLLSVANACSALAGRDVDVAVAGGVDLSLDPFELIGFAKAGALAEDAMRVFDERSSGFWPGEGCGMLVLMRAEEALARGARVYAVVRGWGISSDGSGGMTRPEVEGQLLALRRAYRRAGVGVETAAYFEGHGTGTAVGDSTELAALSRARLEADAEAPPAAIGSIKANIGHTKAAAGVAGLIKAAMALDTATLPPATACERPHSEFEKSAALRVLSRSEPWPADRALRAGVSAMGFGGINTHIVLDGVERAARAVIKHETAAQDAELFLFASETRDGLVAEIARVASYAERLSLAELTDLAAALEREIQDAPVRAAVVAATADELARGLARLRERIENARDAEVDIERGVFFAEGRERPRLAFLFPGQGSPAHLSGGLWRRRFACVEQLYDHAELPRVFDGRATAVAQPAIVTASLAGLRALAELGIDAVAAVGHSLGELTALYWAGALDEEALLRIAAFRGAAMGALNGPTGAMASIAAEALQVRDFLNGDPVVMAGFNAPRQTVVAGEAGAVAAAIERARSRGWKAAPLNVSHAFHSPLVAAAAATLAGHLEGERFGLLERRVASTVTGAVLESDADLKELIRSQVTLPVRFAEAVDAIARDVDLWIEVGPGSVLSGLLREGEHAPAIALDAGGESLAGLLKAAGAAYVLGAPVRHRALFEDRLVRAFALDWKPRFFASPCEQAPVTDDALAPGEPARVDVHPAESLAGVAPLDVVRRLVAERAELPPSEIRESDRLLSDLHLNSIVVGQIVAEAARRLGLAPPIAPSEYADAKLGEVARALEEIARVGPEAPRNAERMPEGVDAWVRCFRVELVERALVRRSAISSVGIWRVFADPADDWAEPYRRAFEQAPGAGVVLCVPAHPNEDHAGLFLAAAREVLATREGGRFVVVQHGGGGAALARTLHLEAPEIVCCVVDTPAGCGEAPGWAVEEALHATRYTEAHYDEGGRRRTPVLKLADVEESNDDRLPLGLQDVLLVTGGGKGIAAECALDLARRSGVRLALVGRSHPERDTELAANLSRMAAAGVVFRYARADVSNAEAVCAAVRDVEAALGPITAILHGAGSNTPTLLSALDETAFRATLAPKTVGLRNVLNAIDPTRVKLLVTFGSLIARTGLRGEADYAVANDWLRIPAERWREDHPECRVAHLDWSVWSGVGMGQKLGRVDALARQGITAIATPEGLRILRAVIARPDLDPSLVVTGRFGDPPTLELETAEAPFLRFLEKPRAHVRGVELIADAELTRDSDPYLDEHVFEGERLLPGVMGLEAMAQAAMALLEIETPPDFENVVFDRPIAAPEGRAITLRVAALITRAGVCEVVLRSSETAFQVDHFRATCRVAGGSREEISRLEYDDALLPLDAQRELYGGLLFHAGRFRRLRGYHRLTSTECIAQIGASAACEWFWRYLPGRLVLGDPGTRDAAVHAVQASIPQALLLPIGVERIITGRMPEGEPAYVAARERSRDGDTFLFDLDIFGDGGGVIESWRGLRLRKMRDNAGAAAGPAVLLGPYLERRVSELLPGSDVRVAAETGDDSDRLFARVLPRNARAYRRADGKPEVAGGDWHVSASHAAGLVMAVASRSPIGCDIEPVEPRPAEMWKDLLGEERFALASLLAGESGLDAACTRVWTVMEALKKAGVAPGTPLRYDAALFSAGRFRVAMFALARPAGIMAAVAIET